MIFISQLVHLFETKTTKEMGMIIWLAMAAIWAIPGLVTGAFDPNNPDTIALTKKCEIATQNYTTGAIEEMPLECTVEPYAGMN